MTLPLALLESALQVPPAWLRPYFDVARRTLSVASSSSVAAALNTAQGDLDFPVRFVEQSALPAGEPYESFIARTACVPTRDNLHDLFNGLVWLSYPKTKQRLNALHAPQISVQGKSGSRGALRDALTLFDENAAILKAPEALLESLRRSDWTTLFVTQREQWQNASLIVFGHALLEKLMQPRKPITAHVWVVDDLRDEAIAASLDPQKLAAKAFRPLPVLGIPGWWTANGDPSFYEDPEVFRRPR